MERSYFKYKIEIKEEVKDTFERLIHLEKVLKNLESKINYQSEKQKEEDQERIEMLREYISALKNRSKLRTDIYFYG